MNDESEDDLVLLHGDLLTEHISGLKSILHSDNVFFVVGPKEHVFPDSVQAIIRISEVIDFQRKDSLESLLHYRCSIFKNITEYLYSLGKTVDHFGFDILFDYLRNQFTILFITPVNFFHSGLIKLQQDIPGLATSILPGGCIKYRIDDTGNKDIIDCKLFKDLYKIEELFH